MKTTHKQEKEEVKDKGDNLLFAKVWVILMTIIGIIVCITTNAEINKGKENQHDKVDYNINI